MIGSNYEGKLDSKCDLKENVKTWLDQKEMNEYWNNIDLWWDRMVLFAKYGEIQRIDDDLRDKCQVKEKDIGKVSDWFKDNIKKGIFFLSLCARIVR